MTLELVSEEVASGDLSTLYPFNALRNHALLLVRTEVRTHLLHLLLSSLLAFLEPHDAFSEEPTHAFCCESGL